MLSIIVQDQGSGIALADQDRIWEPFFVTESSRRQHPQSVGQGLYLCRLICEKLGGDIAVYSDGRSGATFEFRFKGKYSYQGHDREQSPRHQSSIQILSQFGILEPMLGKEDKRRGGGGGASSMSSMKLMGQGVQSRDNQLQPNKSVRMGA